MSSAGKLTAKIGEILEGWLPQGLEVLYDHGDPSKANVGEIVAWTGVGQEPSQVNRLAALDIAVVKRVDGHPVACAVIEIEESDDRPKNVLGDFFGTLLGDQIGFGRGESKERITVEARTALILMARGPASHQARMQTMVNAVKACRGLQLGRNSAIGHVMGAVFETDEELEEKLKKHVSDAIGRF